MLADTTEQEMADMMVGRQVLFTVEKKPTTVGEVILDIENLSVKNQKAMGLQNFSLQIRAGEIVGLAGVDGNGQAELVEAISGLAKTESGKIRLKGKDIAGLSIRERMKSGIALIPEDRQKHGLIMEFSLEDNFVLKKYNMSPFSKRGILNREAISSHANEVMALFDVRSGQGGQSPTNTLSGGNQQKAVVGREIDSNPDLLIAVQPTRGLDVGAIEYIHKAMLRERDKGRAVLLVSLELDEVFAISDRILVIYEGKIVKELDPKTTTHEEIGLYMAGVHKGDHHEQ